MTTPKETYEIESSNSSESNYFDDFDDYDLDDYDIENEEDKLDEYFYNYPTPGLIPPTQEELETWEEFNREIERTFIPNDYKEWM